MKIDEIYSQYSFQSEVKIVNKNDNKIKKIGNFVVLDDDIEAEMEIEVRQSSEKKNLFYEDIEIN